MPESLYEANWNKTRNLAELPYGLVRSILGYAGESLVIGRALACGFNLFFKAWRDSKYDAVLDAAGVLFRIEIKQSGDVTQISCTSGGRSGRGVVKLFSFTSTNASIRFHAPFTFLSLSNVCLNWHT
jgi:hypothetical protein